VNAAEVLTSVPLLADLPQEEIDHLAALAEPFTLASGEALFEEGDVADAVYVIATGLVESRKRLPGGRDMTANEQGPGTMFGEMAIIAGSPRLIGVTAVEETTGLVLDAHAVQMQLGVPREGTRILAQRLGREAVGVLRRLIARLTEAVDADPRASEPPPAPEGPPPAVVEVVPEPGETEYLRTLLFLSDFDADQLEHLFGGMRRLWAPRGATLVEEGTQPDALLIVLRGAVESTVRRGGAAGRVRLSGPGRVVTPLGVLDDGPAPVTCRARERSLLVEVTRERLAELTTHPDMTLRTFFRGLYRDTVDAIVQADRPLSRMAAARP
jgi:CRP-like cAMP-binding protein